MINASLDLKFHCIHLAFNIKLAQVPGVARGILETFKNLNFEKKNSAILDEKIPNFKTKKI